MHGCPTIMRGCPARPDDRPKSAESTRQGGIGYQVAAAFAVATGEPGVGQEVCVRHGCMII